MNDPKYYLTTRRTCQKCGGKGVVEKIAITATTWNSNVNRCGPCSGLGTITSEQEVFLQSVGEGKFVISGRWVEKETYDKDREPFYERQNVT